MHNTFWRYCIFLVQFNTNIQLRNDNTIILDEFGSNWVVFIFKLFIKTKHLVWEIVQCEFIE